jgi:hypothetical protein
LRNRHLHALFVDGIYTRADKSSTPVFHPIPSPTKDDVERLCNQIVKSVVRMLRKSGWLVEEEQEDTTLESESALHACRKISLSRGRYGSVRTSAGQQLHLFDSEWTAPRTSKKYGLVANTEGFSLEASVHFGAHDRVGRERILKYCFRFPFSMERLSVLRDGSVAYLTKYGRGARRHLILSKLEFLCRVASLIPPPKIPMVRYSGVLAPNSSYRTSVVPKRPKDPCLPPLVKRTKKRKRVEPKLEPKPQQVSDDKPIPDKPPKPTKPKPRSSTSYISWAELLKRSFGVCVLMCSQCGSMMRLVATLTSLDSVQRILGHRTLPTAPIPLSGPYTLGFDEFGYEISGQRFEELSWWDGVDVLDVPLPDG